MPLFEHLRPPRDTLALTQHHHAVGPSTLAGLVGKRGHLLLEERDLLVGPRMDDLLLYVVGLAARFGLDGVGRGPLQGRPRLIGQRRSPCHQRPHGIVAEDEPRPARVPSVEVSRERKVCIAPQPETIKDRFG